MNLILCGMPGSGKTTVAKKIAELWGWKLIDTDALIEAAYTAKTGLACTCRQISLKEGADYFRILEKQQILQLKLEPPTIIAVGGGTLLNPVNLAVLRREGCLIYLKADPKVLWERVKQRETPSYLDLDLGDPEKAFYELAEQRQATYESVANVTLEVSNLSQEQIVSEIVRRLEHG